MCFQQKKFVFIPETEAAHTHVKIYSQHKKKWKEAEHTKQHLNNPMSGLSNKI